MKPKVYSTYQIPERVKDFMEEYCEILQWNGDGRIPRDVLLKEVANVDGLYTVGSSMEGRIDEELLVHSPHLKVVSNVSVGYNNFDVESMNKEKNHWNEYA